ncbi:MAG: hypothetical protein K1X57_03410 [Gemmataceae bacterium]|nr:hypothetical protein [Gemmataceae bacterium]
MTEQDWKLMVAADVSGDLSPGEQALLRTQLAIDPHLRALQADLLDDARRLRQLPIPFLPSDFTADVLSGLRRPPIVVAARQTPKGQFRRAGNWMLGLATLAALIVTWIWLPTTPPRGGVAPVAEADFPVAQVKPADKSHVAAQVKPPVDVPDVNVPRTEKSPTERPPSDVFTSRPEIRDPTIRVERPRVSLPLTARELTSGGLDRVRDELGRAEDHRIELFAKDPARTTEQFVQACRGRGMEMLTDPITSEALRRKLRSGYSVYCEALSAKETTAILKSLLATETAPENLVLAPVIDADRKQMKSWLGFDPMDDGLERLRSGASKGARPPVLIAGVYPMPRGQVRDNTVFQERLGERSQGKLRLFVIIRGIGS